MSVVTRLLIRVVLRVTVPLSRYLGGRSGAMRVGRIIAARDAEAALCGPGAIARVAEPFIVRMPPIAGVKV